MRHDSRGLLIRAWRCVADEPLRAMLIFTMLATVVLVIAVAVRTTRERASCREAGGRIVEYNCETYYIDTGGLLVPQRRCDWRCDLPSEAP